MIDFSQLTMKPHTKSRERGSQSEDFASQFAGLKSRRMADKSEEGPLWATESIEPASWEMPVDQIQVSPESRVIVLTDPRGPGADRYRYLRMCFRQFKDAVKLGTVLITSPEPEDGKSTTAINLATALADSGKNSVLVIEADLHRPSIATKLGLEDQPGLADCLESGMDPLTLIRRLDPLQWCLLQAGKPRGNPADLIQSDAVADVIQRCAAHYDWILIDTPPILPLTDAASLMRHVDASVLVVRADKTQRRAIEEALTRLGPKHVLGIILNGAERVNQLYSKYSGYYGKPKA